MKKALFTAAFFILFGAATGAGFIASHFIFGQHCFGRIQQNLQVGNILGLIRLQFNFIFPTVLFKYGLQFFRYFFCWNRYNSGIFFSADSDCLFTIIYFFHLITLWSSPVDLPIPSNFPHRPSQQASGYKYEELSAAARALF